MQAQEQAHKQAQEKAVKEAREKVEKEFKQKKEAEKAMDLTDEEKRFVKELFKSKKSEKETKQAEPTADIKAK